MFGSFMGGCPRWPPIAMVESVPLCDSRTLVDAGHPFIVGRIDLPFPVRTEMIRSDSAPSMSRTRKRPHSRSAFSTFSRAMALALG